MNPPQVYMCCPSWTLLPPPSPYHPSGSSQCTSPKHPVLCIEPGLATRFIHDIIHVSMPFSQIFPPVVMYGCELDYKESWAPKDWCFWTVVLKKTLESPLDCKEIKPVNPKGNQSWIFVGKTDAEAETPILWPPDVNWLFGKDPNAVKDWRKEEKGTTEDEMVGWHHWLEGYESEQALGVGDRQGSLACCCLWGSKESDTTKGLNSAKKQPRYRLVGEWINMD